MWEILSLSLGFLIAWVAYVAGRLFGDARLPARLGFAVGGLFIIYLLADNSSGYISYSDYDMFGGFGEETYHPPTGFSKINFVIVAYPYLLGLFNENITRKLREIKRG